MGSPEPSGTPLEFVDRACQSLQRADPIPKLLPQVRLGRMPKDSSALRAIITSWLETFAQILNDAHGILDEVGVRRLDPNPRIAVLIEAGLLTDSDPQVESIRAAYREALEAAQSGGHP